MPDDLPPAELDLVRFQYVARHRAEAMDLSYTQLTRLTGISRRQISDAMNGKRIGAGPTYVLCAALGIDMDTLLPVETQERLWRIRRMAQEVDAQEKAECDQSVTPPVTRETFSRSRQSPAATAPLGRPAIEHEKGPDGSSPSGSVRPKTGSGAGNKPEPVR